MNTIEGLTTKIVEWADGVFPERKPESALLKLFEEVGELVRSPASPGEYADICIMVFDLAHMHGVDLTSAIQEKIEINKARTWTKTKTGIFQHDIPVEAVRVLTGVSVGADDSMEGVDFASVTNVGGFKMVTCGDPEIVAGVEAIREAYWQGKEDFASGASRNPPESYTQDQLMWYNKGWDLGCGEAP